MSSESPQRVAVVGAGMVGLATAWFLQERGVEVTVIDRQRVAAGASLGNAGWLTPGIATPLPEPAVLNYGIRAVFSPNSPVYVPPSANRDFLRFVTGFMRHSTMSAWKKAMASLVPVNDLSLAAFEELTDGGVEARTRDAVPFTAAYENVEERTTLLEEIQHIHASGGNIAFDVIDGDRARELVPALSEKIACAIILHGQKFIHPGDFVTALGRAVEARGGRIVVGMAVRAVRDMGRSVLVETDAATAEQFDAVVIASGAWLPLLARQHGVKHVVQAGRGYSFSVAMEHVPDAPVYFPVARVALTPLGERLRVAGMMEFRRPEEALDPRRIAAIVESARPLLRGVDLDHRQEEWVGSRPCTVDGLPLIGATRTPRVFVAGGHGMWGITLGPITGRLLAEQITTGVRPAELAPFDPLR